MFVIAPERGRRLLESIFASYWLGGWLEVEFGRLMAEEPPSWNRSGPLRWVVAARPPLPHNLHYCVIRSDLAFRHEKLKNKRLRRRRRC